MKLRGFHLGLALLFSAGSLTTSACTSPVDPQSEQGAGMVSLPDLAKYEPRRVVVEARAVPSLVTKSIDTSDDVG